MTSLSAFTLPLLDGTPQPLAAYAGKVVLVVNTASQCGHTPQYGGLEALWRAHGDEGLVVLGFPCNQFGGQEPGTAVEIAEFCEVNFGVSFPLFARLDVNGPHESPLYAWLKSGHPGDIEWNFAKFLIGRDGQVAARFAPDVQPADLAGAILQQLAA
ncbi:glutathione peroxidase [Devosia ginsengisoli]|uniref:glutathione peroxidase n=1 Tax=Devosia ginsengisoli TaxID=400770 RepID=UPI0026F04FE4|nr:glutathione peroxidase [Devosia ginsengisoli]MCR6656547.1 glutathione peroxidase [Opitutus sp.]MCR6670986.1 glutathione peroxidase [Devosia ginsengisoli]